MRVLLAIVFVLACALESLAQTPVSGDVQPGVSILQFKWFAGAQHNFEHEPTDPAPNKSSRSPLPAAQRQSNTVRQVRTAPAMNSERDVFNDQTFPDQPQLPLRRRQSGVKQYVYQLKIKNTGETKIEGFDWEYIFVDPLTREELDRHKFQTLARVKPNQASTLTGVSTSSPTRVVTARGLAKDARQPFDERVVINCVLYSDGLLWKNRRRESVDCAALSQLYAKRKK